MKLPEVTWNRHERFYDPELCRGSLLWLVFDIPYFDACGIFPPFHIANEIFLSGGSPGGMGPGATWDSFSISEEEYDALADAVINTPKSKIKPHTRYASQPLTIDHSFDHIQTRLDWLTAVCAKHRSSWREKLRNAGLMK